MDSNIEERCICQICTCGRHRCRKHPQQETLELSSASKRHSADQLMKTSLAQTDYALSRPNERPVIKKLVDNLHVSGGQLEAKPSLRTDYPEFDVRRPVIHRLSDQLKTSGQAAELDAPGQFTTLSQDEYRPLDVKRPEGGRKLRSSLKVVGSLDAVTTSSSYHDHENYVRPTVQRIPDKIKLEGQVADSSSVSNADYRQFKAERPVIKRLQSSLRIPNAGMDNVKTLSQDTYQQMPVSRPKRHLQPDQLQTGQGEFGTKAGHLHEDYRQFTAERPVIKKLQDNLAVASTAKFEAQSTKNDYPVLPDYTKPIRKKMEDTLKFSGPMEPMSQAKTDYVEFHAERPVIKKLQDNIPVHPANGGLNVQPQSVQRDYGQFEAKRPVIHRLRDNLKMEGLVEAQSAYAASYVPGEPVRPEIKRMHSTLGLARGEFTKESVIHADFPEHSVSRPHISKPVNQLQPHDASWGPAGERPAAGSRKSIHGVDHTGPSMSRARQMESHIPFGKGDAGSSMLSLVKESYVPLEGAHKAKLARPPTSNRIQDSINGTGTMSRTAANNKANLQLQQADALKQVRDQVAARRKHQVTDSSVPINQPGHQSTEVDRSLYTRSYLLPAIEKCPASVLGVEDKSSYQFTREMHNHRFYKPVDIAA